MDDPTVANQFEPTGASQMPSAGPVKTVCIEKQAEGTFKVGLEKPESEPMPGGAPDMEGMEGMPPSGVEEPEGDMKPAAGIDEALSIARQLLEGDQASPEDQALAGYNNGKRNMPSGMGVGKVFGEG